MFKFTQNYSIQEILQRGEFIAPDVVNQIKAILGSPNMSFEAVEKELSLAGGHDLANLLRFNNGVSYNEIVYDVCMKLGIPASKLNEAHMSESKILRKVFADILDKITPDQRKNLIQDLKLPVQLNIAASGSILAAQILTDSLGFTAFKASVITANIIAHAVLGHGLSFSTNAALTSSLGAFIDPVSMTLTGAWLLNSLAGPAYRKTGPVVVRIALLRLLIDRREIEKRMKANFVMKVMYFVYDNPALSFAILAVVVVALGVLYM